VYVLSYAVWVYHGACMDIAFNSCCIILYITIILNSYIYKDATTAVRPRNLQTRSYEYTTLPAECDGRLIPTRNFHENDGRFVFVVSPWKKYITEVPTD